MPQRQTSPTAVRAIWQLRYISGLATAGTHIRADCAKDEVEESKRMPKAAKEISRARNMAHLFSRFGFGLGQSQ
jgi:hypothetical protein